MNAYEQKQAERKERLEERAAKALGESASTYQQARSMASAIPFGQPILTDHYSARRDRNYRARIHDKFGKAFALDDKAKHYAAKAAAVGTAGISSDDPEAVAKLRVQLEELKAAHERMVQVNKVIRSRKGDEESQVDGLLALGWLTNERARELVRGDFAKRVGYPAYALTNSNANIRRVELRIKELEKAAERADKEEEGKGYTYREDTTENRVMFLFPGKPDAEIREVLKRNAFKWSPSRGAWIRQLNGNGIYAAKCVREKLDAKYI